jgi:hypothetical protein
MRSVGTIQEGPMTDIAYQTATTSLPGKSALLSRLAAWCTHFAEGIREGHDIAARYHALSRLRPRISPAAALTVRPLHGQPSALIEVFAPDFC